MYRDPHKHVIVNLCLDMTPVLEPLPCGALATLVSVAGWLA